MRKNKKPKKSKEPEKPRLPDEIIIMDTRRRNMNRDIHEFKEAFPDFQILTVSVYGTGGQFGGTSHYSVIWIRKTHYL